MNLVTVFRGWNGDEAQLIRSRLDAAGFHPVVMNEHGGVEMMGGFGGGSAKGGILVQVPEEEAADAREFLAAPPAE